MAWPPAGLPGVRVVAGPVRVRRETRDGSISREGSVELRRALISLGVGLLTSDAPAKTYAAALRARGKHGGVIVCAMANRANRIAFALVRDQTGYQATRWV